TRNDQGRRRTRLRRDLCQRGSGRHRPRAAGSGADHGSHGLWSPGDQRVHLDPQHGGVDDRQVRWRRDQGAHAAGPRHHGPDGQLSPDRAGFRFGRGGAQDHRPPRRRSLRRYRHQAVHLGRRGERSLRDDGAHRRRWAEGHHSPGDREGHAGRQLWRAREETGSERLSYRAGHPRQRESARRQPRRRGRTGLRHRHGGAGRRAAEHRRSFAWRGAASPRRGGRLR
ncbi:hypothetical protein OY671_009145, partial [Metschnikowia pulcherrima]